MAFWGCHVLKCKVLLRDSTFLINLIQLYLPLCDTWVIYDNSGDEPHLVAERPFNQQVIIYDPSIWQQITEVIHE